MVKHSIGQKIRDLRLEKDYTLKTISGKLGISISAYAKIERDETDPQASRLIEIAKLLGVEVGYFFAKTTSDTASSKQTKFSLASKNDINELRELIVALRKDVDRIKAKNR
jgi:transcriptional regulator with XRE-family HTH domain